MSTGGEDELVCIMSAGDDASLFVDDEDCFDSDDATEHAAVGANTVGEDIATNGVDIVVVVGEYGSAISGELEDDLPLSRLVAPGASPAASPTPAAGSGVEPVVPCAAVELVDSSVEHAFCGEEGGGEVVRHRRVGDDGWPRLWLGSGKGFLMWPEIDRAGAPKRMSFKGSPSGRCREVPPVSRFYWPPK